MDRKTDTRELNNASSIVSRGLQVPPVVSSASHEVFNCLLTRRTGPTRDELGHVIPYPHTQQSRRRRQAHQTVELHRIRAAFSLLLTPREEAVSSLVSYRIPHHITLQGSSQRRRGLSQVAKDLPRPSVNTCYLHHQDEDEQRRSRKTFPDHRSTQVLFITTLMKSLDPGRMCKVRSVRQVEPCPVQHRPGVKVALTVHVEISGSRRETCKFAA